MRTVRIYEPGDYEPGQTLSLSPSASQHLGLVLRLKPGDPVVLFAGDDREFQARLLQVTKKGVTVEIDSVIALSRESPCAIHLAQALSKGDRMEMVIQKAVELGVASITPLLTQRSVVRLDQERVLKKQAQWKAIAVAACEQSGRNRIPEVRPLGSLDAYLKACSAPSKWVLSPAGQQSWRTMTLPKVDLALLIGPEGGLTDEEVKAAEDHGFASLRLGPRVLRTETAAIAAMTLLQALAGDL